MGGRNFDDSHFAVQGMTIAETVPALAPHTVHTHIKDFVGRVPSFEFVVPGDGEYDLSAYLRAMAAAGYDGFITAEVSVMAQRQPGFDALAAAARSHAALTRACAAAGVHR